jgi:hypothetical protein
MSHGPPATREPEVAINPSKSTPVLLKLNDGNMAVHLKGWRSIYLAVSLVAMFKIKQEGTVFWFYSSDCFSSHDDIVFRALTTPLTR